MAVLVHPRLSPYGRFGRHISISVSLQVVLFPTQYQAVRWEMGGIFRDYWARYPFTMEEADHRNPVVTPLLKRLAIVVTPLAWPIEPGEHVGK
jgi:hypothetical protein